MRLSEELDWMVKNWGVNPSRLANCRDRAKQLEAASDELEMERATNARLAKERDELKAQVNRLPAGIREVEKQRDIYYDKCMMDDEAKNTESPSFAQDPWAAFPPPAGESWHNPDGLTPEQFGCRLNEVGGWRPLLRSEVLKNDSAEKALIWGWLPAAQQWCNNGSLGYAGNSATVTYRTRAPLPTKHAPKREVFELPCVGFIAPDCVNAQMLAEKLPDNDIAIRDRIREIEARMIEFEATIQERLRFIIVDIEARLERGGL